VPPPSMVVVIIKVEAEKRQSIAVGIRFL